MASQEEEEQAQKMGLIGDDCIYDLYRTDFQRVPIQGTSSFKLDDFPGDCIAVNKNYIGVAVQSGIRILNKKKFSEPCLIEGTGRVTDMRFFSEDNDQLASISCDGLLYVWEIIKGKDKELMGRLVLAVKIGGECVPSDNVLCWHCQRINKLGIAIGKTFLRFDILKVKSNILDTCSGNAWEITRQSPGVHYVGHHDSELTDLSVCCRCKNVYIWVSAAKDGTIKLWDEKYMKPIAELRLEKAVISTKFITSPYCSDHIILVTGASSSSSQGEVEVKLWTSSVEDGKLGTNAGELWHCRQTLVLKSSARAEGVLFDQLLAISRPGLLLLANAKTKTVYAIHLEYGHNSAATRMDYITEFTKTMPNLSLIVSSELLSGDKWIVQLYCVQTRAINRYDLDFSCCSPPPAESLSVALPAHNTEETVQQFQHFQKTLSLLISKQEGMDKKNTEMLISVQEGMDKKITKLISMQEGMDKKITMMEDAQKEIQEQIAGQMFFHRPLALVVADIIDSALSKMTDGGTSSVTDMQDAYPISHELKLNVEKMIQKSDYENAFATALKEGPEAVGWLCMKVGISGKIKKNEISLSKDVLYGLLTLDLTSAFPQMKDKQEEPNDDLLTQASSYLEEDEQEEPNDDLLTRASSYLEEAREILLLTKMTLQQIDGQQ